MQRLAFLYLVFCLAGFSACGGGGGGDGGGDGEIDSETGSGDVAADVAATLDIISSVVSTSLNVSSSGLLVKSSTFFLKTAGVDQHVHCSSGGPAAVTGTIDGTSTEGTFDLAVDFNDCDGLDGDVDFEGTFATPDETADFEVTFTGSVGGNGCSLATDELEYSFSAETGVIAAPVLEMLAGSLTGTCTEPDGSATISCDFTDGIDPDDTDAIEAACSCSGDGCGD